MLRPLPPLRNSGKRRFLPTIALAALALVLVFGGSLALSLFSPGAHAAATPFFKMATVVRNEAAVFGAALFSSKAALVRENTDLRQRLLEADAEALTRAVLSEENAALKKLLGREDERQVILATVLSRPSSSPFDTLLIDIGADKGIKAGDQVSAFGAVIIGRVGVVYEKSALVKLFSAPGEEQQVIIGTSTPAKAVGVGGGNFRIILPKGVAVGVGDPVSLSSIGPDVFGRVEEIESGSSDTFQRILFQSPINLFALRWVEVLRP